MNLVGIDPGISGAISILRDGNISMVIDMPTMTEGTKSKKQINAAELANILTKENSFQSKFFGLTALFGLYGFVPYKSKPMI